MKEVTNTGGKRRLYGGIIVDVAEEGLTHVQKVLAGIDGGWQKAVGSALSRAAASGKTAAKSAVAEEYIISQSDFLRETRNINHFTRTGDGGVEVSFGFAGNVIPLMRFDTRVDGSGRVFTHVRRNSARQLLDSAFRAQMGAHTGIYERVGVDRFPVKELYGPATPQMMYANEDVMDAVEEKMAETYEKRIDHETMRILNGDGR